MNSHDNTRAATLEAHFLPVTAYTFSTWSNAQESPIAPFDDQWIPPGSSTLIVGDNASALAINWAKSHRAVTDASKCPLYIKGEEPGETNFTRLLTLSQKQGLIKLQAVRSCDLQDFPLHPRNSGLQTISFRWIIVNKELPPWQQDWMWHREMSLLEKVLLKEEIHPPMIFLDGFLWLGRMTELRAMLKRLKKKLISVVVLNSEMPPEHFIANSIWDNVAEIKPWRTWRCGKYEIVFNYRKYCGRKTRKRFRLTSKNGIDWREKGTDYDFLKPVLLENKDNFTAAQIVNDINNPMVRVKNTKPRRSRRTGRAICARELISRR